MFPKPLFPSGGDHAVESPDGRFLYYLNKGGLWKVPLEGGEETRVLESVFNDNFAIVDEGIYFIPDSKPRTVQFLSFTTRRVTTTAKVAQEPAWGFFRFARRTVAPVCAVRAAGQRPDAGGELPVK